MEQVKSASIILQEVIYDKEYIRSILNSIYSIQKLRIEMGNRIISNFKRRISGNGSASDEEIEEEMGISLTQLCTDYKHIADYVAEEGHTLKKYFKTPEGFITNETEFVLMDNYMKLLEQERSLTKQLEKNLKNFAIYNEFLVNVCGCGPLMSGVILAYLDPHSARHCSSFWKYCGLDVTFVEKEIDGEVLLIGEGTGTKHAKLNTIEYISKDGTKKTKNGITYNPFVKSKLIGVLATSFIMCGTKSHYNNVYRDYKMRLQNEPIHADKTPAHINNMAKRYAVKMFLKDLWIKWRELEGLEITEGYEVAVLGRKPHHAI